jgi:hypothetical protein
MVTAAIPLATDDCLHARVIESHFVLFHAGPLATNDGVIALFGSYPNIEGRDRRLGSFIQSRPPVFRTPPGRGYKMAFELGSSSRSYLPSLTVIVFVWCFPDFGTNESLIFAFPPFEPCNVTLTSSRPPADFEAFPTTFPLTVSLPAPGT